jgi:tRNA pseudouridine38-40 synthase
MKASSEEGSAAPPAQRWKCVCAYHGGFFHGWQSQANAQSVQDRIEEALQRLFERQIRIHGSGRTDAGVHALGQVFHFDADWPAGPPQLLAALRTRLPTSIQISSVRPVGPDFHARFSAHGKRYQYRLVAGYADPFESSFAWSTRLPLDIGKMREAARRLVGQHDFAAFTAENGDVRETTVRHVRRLEVIGRGRRLKVVAEADGFLYKMVRSLVGTVVQAGLNRITADEIEAILQSKQRVPAVQTAPAHGLFLEKVFYHSSSR